jgi:hypothetical protein
MKRYAMKTNWIKSADLFRSLARYPLLILGILVFLFALLSGSEGYGGGIMGIIKNSPNAIPWAILLILVLVAWKWELIGGILIVGLGIAMFYLLNWGALFFSLFPFFLTIIITILGSFFIVSWLLRRNAEQSTAGRGLINPRNLLLFYSVIIIICLMIGLNTHNRYLNVNKRPDKTSILNPKDGEQVSHQISIVGGLTKADSLKELWLVVQPIDSVLYHPQPGPLQKAPRPIWWNTTAYFGEPDDAPGKKYHVYLFSATEEASKVIKDYATESSKIGQWHGLKTLPDGLTPLDTITVTRK